MEESTPQAEPSLDPARLDRDPDAIAWARAKIIKALHRAEGFEQHARSAGNLTAAEHWRITASFIRTTLLGGRGCVIASFDDRLPGMLRAMDAAEAQRSGKKEP